MNLIATAFVHGEPKAQPRPKAFARNGRAGIYDPGTAEGWKGAIAAALRSHAGKLNPDALRVDLTFFFPRPKSHFGTGKNASKLKPSAPVWHLKKPDVDNLEKAVFDALSEKSGIGLWKDDTQIIDSRSKKRWADDTSPGMQIDVYSVNTPEVPTLLTAEDRLIGMTRQRDELKRQLTIALEKIEALNAELTQPESKC